uniref:Uncharacterized protein n=1 Tax=Chrysemys picta bellii TaxID=8478 RepID=A0A8C3HQX8_CHRPI
SLLEPSLQMSVILAILQLSGTEADLRNSYYVVVIPAIIHHLGHEKVCIHLSSLPETVHLAVTLEMQTQNHTLMEKDVEKPGIFECISFKVSWSSSEVASVHAVIHIGDRVSYEGRKKVLVRRQTTRIVIDTDKPFYKPGETGTNGKRHVELGGGDSVAVHSTGW